MEDWRLTGDFDGIKNKIFKKRYFHTKSDNDHEHCCFCWKKITDLETSEEHDTLGYVTLNENCHEEWVCEECFEDFKTIFNFKTDSE